MKTACGRPPASDARLPPSGEIDDADGVKKAAGVATGRFMHFNLPLPDQKSSDRVTEAERGAPS